MAIKNWPSRRAALHVITIIVLVALPVLMALPVSVYAAYPYWVSETEETHNGTLSLSYLGTVANITWATSDGEEFPNAQGIFGIHFDTAPTTEFVLQAVGDCPSNDYGSSSGYPRLEVYWTDANIQNIAGPDGSGFYVFDDIFTGTPYGVRFFARSTDTRGGLPEFSYDCDIVIYSVDGGGPPTATPTSTRTPLATYSPPECFATFTPIPGGSTATNTPFGAATSTPNLTATATRTPIATLNLPPVGSGQVEQFTSYSNALWQDEGIGIFWMLEGGHADPASMHVDLTVSRGPTDTSTRLVYGRPVQAGMVLTGWFRFSDDAATVDSDGGNMTFTLLGYDGGWETASGSEVSVLLVYPEDAGGWHLFRMTWLAAYDAIALAFQDTGPDLWEDGSYLYIDDLLVVARGGQGGGGLGGNCGTPFPTPQPLGTIAPLPECDENMCIGVTHVPGTPPCLGYDAFDIEIPALPTVPVNGIQVCFDRYELGDVYIGPYDFSWLMYLGTIGVPILLGLWLVLRARA